MKGEKGRRKKEKFVVPNAQACAEAIGIMWKKKGKGERQLILKHKEVYEEGKIGELKGFMDPSPFLPIDKPADGDWLDEFPEEGQSFLSFTQDERITKPDWKRDSIFIIPFGDFNTPELCEFSDILYNYCTLFYCMKVQKMDSIDIKENKMIRRRKEPYNKDNTQFLTNDILKIIGKNLPAKAYCAIGFTLEDLYPDEGWNFVFGEATDKGTGVFSFARYSPQFYKEEKTKESDHLLLERSLKVMVHEIGHMFGLPHCIYYKCIMNGSNGLEEEDKTPFHLCPVCLRKLHFSIGFDKKIKERYIGLRKFYQDMGFQEAADWILQWPSYKSSCQNGNNY